MTASSSQDGLLNEPSSPKTGQDEDSARWLANDPCNTRLSEKNLQPQGGSIGMANSLNGSTSSTEPGSEERVANRCTQRHGKLCRKTVHDGLFESGDYNCKCRTAGAGLRFFDVTSHSCDSLRTSCESCVSFSMAASQSTWGSDASSAVLASLTLAISASRTRRRHAVHRARTRPPKRIPA